MEDLWKDSPLSLEELNGARKSLYPMMSFWDIMRRYSINVSSVWGREWTHKCSCPHHKDGGERTPSFFFSEASKKFYCFGCSIGGDIFDLIALMENRQWHELVRELLSENKIDISNIDVPNRANYETVFNINRELSLQIKQYVSSCEKTSYYESEKIWADRMFRRIDDSVSALEKSNFDLVEINSFKMQVSIDIQRRKALMKLKE